MRWLLPAALLLLLVSPTLAKPADFCQRHPTNPQCLSGPTPTATTIPTAVPSVQPPSGWTLRFEDQFSTDIPLGSFPSATGGRWGAYPYPWSTLGGYYYPEKVNSVSGGTLKWFLHRDSGTGRWLMSAPYPRFSDGTTNQLYGRYEMRWRADSLDGYYAVPLLWPQSEQWPRDGELDFPEGDLDRTIKGYIHYQGATSGGDQKECLTSVPVAGAWHTTVTEWSPNAVRYILDGVVICEATTRIPNTPMHWVLQITTSPGGLPVAGTQGYFEADYVRIWSYSP